MPWAKLDVGWYRDPKISELSKDAELLYVRAIAYAVDELSDGVIVPAALSLLGAKLDNVDTAAAELVTAKLWWKRNGRFRFPPRTWAKWQTSRADVEAKRADAAARQRRSRARRHAVTDASVTSDESVSHAHVTAPETDNPRERNPSLSNPPDSLQQRNGSEDNPRRISDSFRAITNREADE